jgi:hypothetical protein
VASCWQSSCSGDRARFKSRLEALRLKIRFQTGAGDRERLEALWRRRAGGEANRRIGMSKGVLGAGRGVMNLDSGSIVLKLSWRIEFIEALRYRRIFSVGMVSVLTV